MWLRLRNVEKKKDVCPFLLFKNFRPLSPTWESQNPFSSWGAQISYQPAQELTLSGLPYNIYKTVKSNTKGIKKKKSPWSNLK